MQRLCEAVLRHRRAFVALFVLAAVACALCIPVIKANFVF